jgi:iron complex outermembrane receptor protein
MNGNGIVQFPQFHQNFTSLNYSLGAVRSFKNIKLRTNLSSGFRAPNTSELLSNGVHEGTNRFEIGNTKLENEQNYQIDIALEYKNEHIEFFANAFYNAIDNYIFLVPNGAVIENTDVFTYNQDNSKLYGGELGFHLHPHPLDWLHYESSFEMVIGKQRNGEYLSLIPANQLNNTIRTEFNLKKWFSKGYASLKLESIFKQNNVSSFETNTNEYNLLHFSLGGNIKLNKVKFEVSFNLHNIFDTAYISHLSRLKRDGVQNIGRTMMFGLNFDI